MLAYNFSTTPINNESRIVEERDYRELVNTAYDTTSIGMVYIRQIPNITKKEQEKPMSNRMARFKKSGLIGCLNDTGITSTNYKDIISKSIDPQSDA